MNFSSNVSASVNPNSVRAIAVYSSSEMISWLAGTVIHARPGITLSVSRNILLHLSSLTGALPGPSDMVPILESYEMENVNECVVKTVVEQGSHPEGHTKFKDLPTLFLSDSRTIPI